MFRRLPTTEPLIKLTPTIKPTGKGIVLSRIKSTLRLFELFCKPINNKHNKQELNIKNVKIFFSWELISLNIFLGLF